MSLLMWNLKQNKNKLIDTRTDWELQKEKKMGEEKWMKEGQLYGDG